MDVLSLVAVKRAGLVDEVAERGFKYRPSGLADKVMDRVFEDVPRPVSTLLGIVSMLGVPSATWDVMSDDTRDPLDEETYRLRNTHLIGGSLGTFGGLMADYALLKLLEKTAPNALDRFSQQYPLLTAAGIFGLPLAGSFAGGLGLTRLYDAYQHKREEKRKQRK